MNTSTTHASTPRPAEALDAAIGRAELAVAERDLRLRGEFADVGRHFRRQTRLAARVVGGTAGGAFLLGWLMSRSARPRRRDRVPDRHDDAGARMMTAPWATLVPLLWPLLPVRWRERVSPGLASFVTGIGLPLLARRVGKHAHKKALQRERQHEAAPGVH